MPMNMAEKPKKAESKEMKGNHPMVAEAMRKMTHCKEGMSQKVPTPKEKK